MAFRDILRKPPTNPPTRRWQMFINVEPADADVKLSFDGKLWPAGPGGAPRREMNFSTPECKPNATGVLSAERAGYVRQQLDIADIGPGNKEFSITLARDVPTRPHRREEGQLHRENRYLLREDGSVWDWRGVSMFLALNRQIAGEDPRPTFDWMKRIGANVARVFPAGVPWSTQYVPGVEPDLWRRPDFEDQVDRLLTAYAEAGLRVELAVITEDTLTVEQWESILNRVYSASAHHWNALVEWCNEPWVGQKGEILNEIIARRNIDQRGVTSAYGIMPAPDVSADAYAPCPFLAYGTAHLDRDMDHFPRNGKELKEMSDANNCQWMSDEPRGLAEYHKDGAGARTNNLQAVAGHAGTSRLFGGHTLHAQCGLEGRPPGPDDPITATVADAVGDIWELIPGDATTGEYCAPHLGNFPLGFVPEDSTLPAGRAYGRRLGDRLWAVTPMTKPEWTPVARDGWTLVKSIADNTVHELRR